MEVGMQAETGLSGAVLGEGNSAGVGVLHGGYVAVQYRQLMWNARIKRTDLVEFTRVRT